jgi:FkbM family methyltransferase
VKARLVAHPAIAPVKPALLRARRLRHPVRFLAREALGRRIEARYRLRGAPGVHVVLRHRTPDVEAFDEIFVQRIYAMPEPVERVLDLGRAPRIADLGANIGLFAAWAGARWPGAAITCVEPDPDNLAVLDRTAAANGGAWKIVRAAAGVADGEQRFLAGQFAISRAARPEETAGATTVAVRDAFALIRDADLVKIDIEGGEWPILADARFARLTARAVALEFHPEGCPAADARAEAYRLLEDAGYTVCDVKTLAPAGYGSLWAWRDEGSPAATT